LTCSKIQHLLAALVAVAVAATGHQGLGRGDDADTRPAPGPVTTAGSRRTMKATISRLAS
jgi:hypothetical protein